MQLNAAHSAHSIHIRLTFIAVSRYKLLAIVQKHNFECGLTSVVLVSTSAILDFGEGGWLWMEDEK